MGADNHRGRLADARAHNTAQMFFDKFIQCEEFKGQIDRSAAALHDLERAQRETKLPYFYHNL